MDDMQIYLQYISLSERVSQLKTIQITLYYIVNIWESVASLHLQLLQCSIVFPVCRLPIVFDESIIAVIIRCSYWLQYESKHLYCIYIHSTNYISHTWIICIHCNWFSMVCQYDSHIKLDNYCYFIFVGIFVRFISHATYFLK